MRIRRADPREARRCAALIASALVDDPVGRLALPIRLARQRRLAMLYEAELRAGAFDHGFVEVAIVDGVVAGVAAWEAPRTHRALRATVRQAPRYALAVGPIAAPAALRAQRRRRAARGPEQHWLLADVAVDAGMRGRGIGAALIASGLDACAPPVVLEATTPASRRLYERLGFEMRATVGIAPGGYPVIMQHAGTPVAPQE